MSSALSAVATTCSTPLRVFFTGLKVTVASPEGWYAVRFESNQQYAKDNQTAPKGAVVLFGDSITDL